jgi:hypothetical protein
MERSTSRLVLVSGIVGLAAFGAGAAAGRWQMQEGLRTIRLASQVERIGFTAFYLETLRAGDAEALRKEMLAGIRNAVGGAEKLQAAGVRFPIEAPVDNLVLGLQVARSEAERVDPALAERIGTLRAGLVEPSGAARK